MGCVFVPGFYIELSTEPACQVRQAARDATKGLMDDGKQPKHTARKGRGRGRGKGRGKGAGKCNTEYDNTAADTNSDKKRKDA